jgi:hypothetical protein
MVSRAETMIWLGGGGGGKTGVMGGRLLEATQKTKPSNPR